MENRSPVLLEPAIVWGPFKVKIIKGRWRSESEHGGSHKDCEVEPGLLAAEMKGIEQEDGC